jgi:hypothetical protein
LMAALFHAPWQTLTVAAFFYMGMIPFAVRKYRAIEKEHGAEEEDMTDLAIGAISLEELSNTSRQTDKED